MLTIPYESEDFPPDGPANGQSELNFVWNDLLWAAVTVGRRNYAYVFRHQEASLYEALFRWSMVRLAVEQTSARSTRLRRTSAAKDLDPSEKGAVNYFLGMTMCKLFSAFLLDTPWLLHLDLFRDQLGAVLRRRSRPDLIGQTANLEHWHGFECKGRISPPGDLVKERAKTQARDLVSVAGQPCSLHVAAITYLQDDAVHFYWADPLPSELWQVEVVHVTSDAWGYYYRPIVACASVGNARPMNEPVEVPHLDLSVELHRAVAGHLYSADWDGARRAAIEARRELREEGFQQDGLRVLAGPSWLSRYLSEGEDRSF